MPAAIRGALITLLNAVTTGSGTTISLPANVSRHTIYLVGAGDIAGAVSIEEAHNKDYAGTWSQIQSVDVGSINDSAIVVHFEGAIAALKVRITTTITGGTLSAYYRGN